MQNRIFAGSARALLLGAATVGLMLLPAVGAGAASIKSRTPGGAPAPSQSNGIGALQGEDPEPYALFPRTNYQWPFRSGPVYGLDEESASLADQPGVVRTQVGTFDLRRGTPSFPAELRASVNTEAAGAQYFIVVPSADAVKDGAFELYRDKIVSQGGAFVAEIGNAAYLVRLNTAAYGAISTDSATLVLEPYHPAFKLAPNIGRAPLFNEADALSSIYKLTLSVFPGEDSAAIAQAIRNIGGNIVRIDPVSVEADLDRSKLPQAAAVPGVSFIEERLPLVMWGEETTAVLQTGGFNGGAKPYHDAFVNGGGRRGTCSTSTTIACQINHDCPGVETCSTNAPQVLMSVDSGIQLDDGDLSDTRTNAGTAGPTHRKVRVYQTTNQFGAVPGGDDRGCDSAIQGGFTHGHVVAATALGNATVTPLRYGGGFQKLDQNNVPRPVDGVAPRAVLVSYDANVTPLAGNCANPNNSGLSVGTIYAGTNTGSLDVAYVTHGARTFNFSWGTTNNPVYGTNANSVDNFLQNRLDAMLFLAAGNDGRDSDQDQIPDPASVSDPATAKNAVVVGASGNVSDPFNGANEQDRSGTSSVGPATVASARIAPILMAPGTDFGTVGGNMGFDSEFSCRSSDNDQTNTVECDVAQGISGTSFSAPAAAGAAILVRDWFAQGFYPDGTSTNPGNGSDLVTSLSGAEVKAVLIASADWMDNSTPAVPTNGHGDGLFFNFRFNREQGYGRIQLNNALPLQAYNPTPAGLIVADGGIGGGRLDITGLSGDIDTGLSQSDTGTFTVCNDDQELRVALAWIDSPGDLLNRNLDLEVRAPSGKIYYGNYFTDDNNRDGSTAGGEDCANGHLTGSTSSLDSSPWSLETCANSVRDGLNPTEAVFLSPDARNDTTAFTADKQTELGTWTVIVSTGIPSAAALQRYAVAVAGGVCLGSSVTFDRGQYVCNQPLTVQVNERDEGTDPTAAVTDGEAGNRTLLQVFTKGTDGIFGTGDDQLVDVEDATSTSNFGFTHGATTEYTSALINLTDANARSGATFGNGDLDVRHGEVIRVTYRDKTSGAYDANKVRTKLASVNCQAQVTSGGVAFGQVGLDTSQLVTGGCERDRRGLFTFEAPDRYMDEGERLMYQVAFQSLDRDLGDVVVSLTCKLADGDSPADCLPGTTQCADPNRANNPPCGALMSILDSPKSIGNLPAGQVATPAFALDMGTIGGTPEVDMILGVTARASGKTVETLLITRNTLNSDEVSTYYSTDYPTGGSEWADWPNTSTGQNPSNEAVDGCLGASGVFVCSGGPHDGDPCTINGNCTPGTCTRPCPPPLTSAGEFFGNGADYRFDQYFYSSMVVNGRNPGISGPWNFDTNNEGFTVGLNNTTTNPLPDTVANWGEDKNFNSVLDWFCSLSTNTVCPGAFPPASCGRCSNNSTIICSGSNVPCGGGGTSCVVDAGLGTCQSSEDRDPQNGLLDDNWSTLGGCGWQTNGTTNSPSTAGGVWHTGRIGTPVPPCLVTGNAVGACQNYELIVGTNNVKNEWELLMSPVVQKVNVCPTGAEPGCGGVADTAVRKVFTVEFTGWAWNMSMDLKDRFAQIRWEFDTDTARLTPIDLVNDAVVLNALGGGQGPISGGNSPLTDGFQVFAPFSGSSSQNGTIGSNRVGRNPCFFETNTLLEPFHWADPWDDDIDNDADGTVDEGVTPNGPLRNFDSFQQVNPPSDGRVNTLEDIYGPSGENYQTAIGFRVFEGNTTQGASQTGYGIAIDDMRIDWREFKLGADATNCVTNGTCANVEVDTTNIFEGNGVLTMTVTDPHPYRCLGGPPCTQEGKNDCDHNGSFANPGDDNDCDNNGIPDVLVRAFSQAEFAGEWVTLNRVGAGPSYRGTLPVSIGGDVPGMLFISDTGSGISSDITVRYLDDWDGTDSGNKCQDHPDPTQQGIVDQGVNLVIGDTGNISIVSIRIDDNTGLAALNDGDGYPDTNELVDLYITVSNKTQQNLTNLVAQASVNDPKIECLLKSVSTLAAMASNTVQELPIAFQFKVAATADRAGAGLTPNNDYSALFTITMSSDQFDLNDAPQLVALDLDLDSLNPAANTTAFTEGFEAGFGNFQFLNLDFNIGSNSASNGMRCSYNDPDFVASNSYGTTECYLGFAAGQSPVNGWHIHGTASADGGRAFLGNQSVHYGVHTPGNPNLDTYQTSQMDAIRTKNAVNLAARVCAALQGGQVKSCNSAADCTTPASACISASPLLTFKHQISTVDNRRVNVPTNQAADRGVLHAQLVGGTLWQKLTPYQNIYDAQGTDFFSNCMFDPTDDGNNEDSYFDPSDPARRLGPSSTCFPEFTFSYIGDTALVPFGVNLIGRASDGPGLGGSIGPGTWVESRIDMSRFRGRSIRFRYLLTGINLGEAATTWQGFASWNPFTGDDGWWVDDIRLTQALGASSPTVTNDTQNHGNTSCGAACNTLTAGLTATPPVSPAPGRRVVLSATATADRCANGALLYQFWEDVNGNGGADSPPDVLLRDFAPNPVFEVAPTAASTKYVVRVKCSSATTSPCNGTDAGATVTVPVSSQSLFFPWQQLRFSNKTTVSWTTPDSGGVEVIRGKLSNAIPAAPVPPANDVTSLLQSGLAGAGPAGVGGDYRGTVQACLANDVTGATATDATVPALNVTFYYLARRSTPDTTWSTYAPKELSGAAGTRDGDLDGPPKATNTCSSPP